MGKFVCFTAQELTQARSVDFVSFLEARGDRLARAGSECLWP